ncbi:MAG: hypothetical protein WDA20_01925 [Desulfuromonadales bacterium]|jgi:hypothetical protein
MKRHERHDTVPKTEKYDEYKILPQFWGWVILLAWSASLILWAMWIHAVIPEADRYWDYGQTAFTPAESIYSTVQLPKNMEPVQQIHPLPGALPLLPPVDQPGADR